MSHEAITQYNQNLEARILDAFRAEGAEVTKGLVNYHVNGVTILFRGSRLGYNRSKELNVTVDGHSAGTRSVTYRIRPTSQEDVTEEEMKAFITKVLARVTQNVADKKADDARRQAQARRADETKAIATELEERLAKAGYPARVVVSEHTKEVKSVTFEKGIALNLIDFLTK